jgi:molybdopterin-guanine dinucleotide biosynthesis protein A
MDDAAILLFAGGDARRFPGKLERSVEDEPMIVRCHRRLRASPWPVYVAAKGSFPAAIDAAIDSPLLIDRRPGGGPLAALHSACTLIASPWIFAVAADMPHFDAVVLNVLAFAQREGDEAVIPQHDGRIEPLAALYDRRAVLREASTLLRGGRSAMRELVARVAARFVPLDKFYFYNVNREADLEGGATA